MSTLKRVGSGASRKSYTAVTGARFCGVTPMLCTSTKVAPVSSAAASVSARRTSYADGEAQLAHLRAECDRTRAVFADLRILQDEAATLVERGAVEQAQQLAERIKATWDELPAGEPDAGPPIVTQLDGGAPP